MKKSQDISIFIKKIRSLNIRDSEIWINEALFGFNHIKEFCKKLERNNNVLEIGSGSGILLNLLSDNFKDLNFEGIEPFGEGFSSLTYLNSLSQQNGISIKNIGYEELSSNYKYDLIFCINVFEHLNDWQNFLDKMSFLLKKNGKLIVLCPNYGFPYESHFRIPVLFNKKITFFFLKNLLENLRIKMIVLDYGNHLIRKKRQVLNHLKIQIMLKDLEINDNLSILEFMVNRFINDREFRKRQKTVGKIAVALRRLGILKILKLFPNFIPYMKLEFLRK